MTPITGDEAVGLLAFGAVMLLVFGTPLAGWAFGLGVRLRRWLDGGGNR
jgi:hypothetical protein